MLGFRSVELVTSNAGSRRPRVLLADDDAVARTALARALRVLDLEVEEACDGGRLLVTLAEQYKNGHSPEEVDLIVTDFRMPVCDGGQILRGLRAAFWTTPVIIVTGYPADVVQDVAKRFGAQVLTKPLDLDRFESLVLACLATPIAR